MTRQMTLYTALLFALLFAGCGQSGPLYLPGNPSEMKLPPQPQQEQADEQEEDEAQDETGNEP